jgi:transcriptional regulator with XRE-family HTH domain
MVDEQEQQGRALASQLGKGIAEKRKQIGWTQANVAERVGVDTETISRFERGVSLPSLITLKKLALVLNTTAADLLAGNSSQPNDQSEIIAALLQGLGEKDRMYVTEMVKQACRHLGSKSV